MKQVVIIVVTIVALAGGAFTLLNRDRASEVPTVAAPDSTADGTTSTQPTSENHQVDEVDVEPAGHSLDDVNSIWVVVNKNRPIDLAYRPDDLRLVDVAVRTDKSNDEKSLREEAATALETLFAAAEAAELPLLLGSGFRDSDLQAFYYNNIVNAYGQAEADRVSARPGTSEHQTGLTADVSPLDRHCYIETCFGDTPEGQWVAANAHTYGFIIRYPEEKESITGYSYEPWHIRYVGTELAQELFELNQTMEEYFADELSS